MLALNRLLKPLRTPFEPLLLVLQIVQHLLLGLFEHSLARDHSGSTRDHRLHVSRLTKGITTLIDVINNIKIQTLNIITLNTYSIMNLYNIIISSQPSFMTEAYVPSGWAAGSPPRGPARAPPGALVSGGARRAVPPPRSPSSPPPGQ